MPKTWGQTMNERQARGECRQCGKKRDSKSKTLCEGCRELLNSQLRQRRQEKANRGLCAISGCNEKRVKGGRCLFHNAKQIEYQRNWRMRKCNSTSKPSDQSS